MRTVRPTRVLSAIVLGTLVLLGLGTWATDTALAEAAGLDVWNISRFENDLRDAWLVSAKLHVQEAELQSRFETNRYLVRQVCEDRMPLSVAAERLWESNQLTPGFTIVIEKTFRGPTVEARTAHNIIFRIETDPDLSKDAKDRILPRLRAEYASSYGVPAPTTH